MTAAKADTTAAAIQDAACTAALTISALGVDHEDPRIVCLGSAGAQTPAWHQKKRSRRCRRLEG